MQSTPTPSVHPQTCHRRPRRRGRRRRPRYVGTPKPGRRRGSQSTGDPHRASVTALRTGVDYSWSKPRPSAIAAAGYTFACRYVSRDTTGKNLTAGEAQALIGAGIDVVTNWEHSASEALNGYAAGASNATEAQRQAIACGMPAGRPIYFSVDLTQAPPNKRPSTATSMEWPSSSDETATAAYAGYYPIQRLFDAGKINWGWQTYAWSGGRWDPRAHLRQVQNGLVLDGASIDRNEAMTVDFGQWGTGGGITGIGVSPVAACGWVVDRVRAVGAIRFCFGSVAVLLQRHELGPRPIRTPQPVIHRYR